MSETIGKYNVILELQTKQQGDISKIKKEASGLKKIFLTAGAAFAGIFAVGVIKSAGQRIFDITKKYQKYNTVLKVALGSQKEASKTMALIEQTAKDTIYSVDELTSSYIKFANRGMKPTRNEIIAIADLAASQGKSFDQLTEAILDAQTGEFERLKEFGIKASSSGTKVMLSFKGVNKEIDKTPEAINKAIIELGKMKGVAGANKEQMKDLAGLVSNIGDKTEKFLSNIGKRLTGLFTGSLTAISGLISKINEYYFPTKKAVDVTRDLQYEFNHQIEVLKLLKPESIARKKLLKEINDKYSEYLPNLIAEKDSIDNITEAQKKANKQFKGRIILMLMQDEIKKETEQYKQAIKDMIAADRALAESKVDAKELALKGASPGEVEKYKNTWTQFINTQKTISQNVIDNYKYKIQKIRDLYQKYAKDLDIDLNSIQNKINKKPEKPETNKSDKKKSREIFDIDNITGGTKAIINAQKELEYINTEYQNILNTLSIIQELNKKGYLDEGLGKELIILFDIITNPQVVKNKIVKQRAKDLTDIKNEIMDTVELPPNDKKQKLWDALLGIDEKTEGIYINSVNSLKNAILDAYDEEINKIDELINKQQERVDKAEKIAEKGNIKQLKLEKTRLEKLQEEREKFAKQQRILANSQIITAQAVAAAEAIKGTTSAFAEGGPAGIITGTAWLLSLGAALLSIKTAITSSFADIPAYAGGIEAFKGKGSGKSDSNIVRISRGERITPDHINKQIGYDFPNAKLPEAIKAYKLLPHVANALITQANGKEYEELKNEIRSLRQSVEAISIVTKIDKEGFIQEIQRMNDEVLLRKKIIG